MDDMGSTSVPVVQVEIAADDQTSVALAQAQARIQAFKTNAGSAGDALTYSMREAREATRLMSEEVGVHLPRALSNVLASSSLIGPAIETMFPLVAAAGFFEVAEAGYKKIQELILDTSNIEKEISDDVSLQNHLRSLTQEAKKLDDEYARLTLSATQYGIRAVEASQLDLVTLQARKSYLEGLLSTQKQLAQQTEVVGTDEAGNEIRVMAEGADTAQIAVGALTKQLKSADDEIANAQRQFRNAGATLGKDLAEAQAKAAAEAQKHREALKKLDDVLFKVYQDSKRVMDELKTSDLPNFMNDPLAALSSRQFQGLGDSAMGPVQTDQAAQLYQIQTNYNAALTELNQLLTDQASKTGAVAAQQQIYQTLLKDFPEYATQIKQAMADMQVKTDTMSKAWDQFGREAGRALDQLLTNTKEWRKTLDTLIVDLVKMVAEMYILSSLKNEFGAGAGITKFFSSFFGGGRASGGSVTAGTPYLVGENGPEIFNPSTSGSIIPNSALGGSGGNSFVYNVDARGAQPGVSREIVMALEATRKSAISGAFVQVKEAMRRGFL
jgi:hypothetical protein